MEKKEEIKEEYRKKTRSAEEDIPVAGGGGH
jgi:hypothetical protein